MRYFFLFLFCFTPCDYSYFYLFIYFFMWLHKISFYKKFPPSEDDCLLLALEILYVWRAFNTCSSAVLNNILSGEVWPFSDLSALNVWVVIVCSSGLNLNLLCSFSWSSQRDLVIAKLSRRSISDLLALFTRRKGNTSPRVGLHSWDHPFHLFFFLVPFKYTVESSRRVELN